MQKQVEAEREKRASILKSEGVRESAINEAEGHRLKRSSVRLWSFAFEIQELLPHRSNSYFWRILRNHLWC